MLLVSFSSSAMAGFHWPMPYGTCLLSRDHLFTISQFLNISMEPVIQENSIASL